MFAVLSIGPPDRENRQYIANDQIGFSETSHHIHAVIPLIVKLQPSSDIAETGESVISKHVAVCIFAIETSQLATSRVRTLTSP